MGMVALAVVTGGRPCRLLRVAGILRRSALRISIPRPLAMLLLLVLRRRILLVSWLRRPIRLLGPMLLLLLHWRWVAPLLRRWIRLVRRRLVTLLWVALNKPEAECLEGANRWAVRSSQLTPYC